MAGVGASFVSDDIISKFVYRGILVVEVLYVNRCIIYVLVISLRDVTSAAVFNYTVVKQCCPL